MKNLLSEVIVSLILALFGVFLIIWADEVTNIFSICAGIVIILYGIVKIVNYFQKKDDILDLILGIIVIVLGGVLVFNASLLKEIISFVIGLYIVITCGASLISAIKKQNKSSIILSSIGVFIGIMCILGKFIVPDIFLKLIGWLLVGYGGISIVNAVLLNTEKTSES